MLEAIKIPQFCTKCFSVFKSLQSNSCESEIGSKNIRRTFKDRKVLTIRI